VRRATMVATLRVDVFDWDDGNIDHIANHGISPEEAEEAALDRRRVGMTVYRSRDELRWGLIGATEEGRILAVILTNRFGLQRVVPARDANPAERRRYRRR
jgi:uncharacterized DUF497 family protein